MKIKNATLLLIGGSVGFIGGIISCVHKILALEKMKNALTEVLSDKIERILYGESTKQHGDKIKVSYQSYNGELTKEYIFVREPVFESRAEAKSVLDAMNKIISTYAVVTVQDYYDLCDVYSGNYKDNLYGWTESAIKTGKIIPVKEGYVIRLPKAVKL